MRRFATALLLGSAMANVFASLYRWVLLAGCLVSSTIAVALLDMDVDGYEHVAILPVGFIIFSVLVLLATWGRGPSFILWVCLPSAFLRYTVFPVLVYINDGYAGRSGIPPSADSYNLAVALMFYEILLIGIVVFFCERRIKAGTSFNPSQVKTLPVWYSVILISASLALIAIFPQSVFLINFVKPYVAVDEAGASSGAVFAGIFFIAAKLFLIISIMHRLAISSRWRKLAAPVAAVFGLFNLMVYFGTNRMAIVLTAVATLWLMRNLFQGREKKALLIMVGMTVALFSLVTGEREYVKTTSLPTEALADNIQVYTGGVYNVAVGIEVGEYYPEARSFKVLLQDFVRPTVGLNLLAKGWDVSYSNVYFNDRVWTYVDRRSQIMPMLAQGYLFFGAILAPLISALFVLFGYWLLSNLNKVKYLEVKFCMALVCLRIGFFWGQNSMNMMNYMSLYLIVPICMLLGFFLLRRLFGRTSLSNNAVETG